MWAVGAVVGLAVAGRVAAQGILEVGGQRAERAVVTVGEALPELDGRGGSLESAMTRALKGVLADLTGKGLQELRACVPAHPFVGDAAGGERVCVVHLSAGSKSKRLEVFRKPGGGVGNEEGGPVFVAVESGVERPARAELKGPRFAALLASWPAYRGGFDTDAVADPIGVVFEVAKPYVPGRYFLDRETMGARFMNGGKSELRADRVLEEERLYARLPEGYDPKRPAGLVVWIDPSNSGRPPEALWPALDELYLICVGAADSGNLRMVANREQLALDAVETMRARYHVDPRRIYTTGMSGGGRVCSMMLACFPEVFAGAVPIVGISCYQNVPNGVGQFWRAQFARPGTETFRLLRTRRMAGITGQKDGNQVHMQHTTGIMKRDGVNIRLYDYPDMGHTMPTPERFAEAMRWVDEPYRERRSAEEAAAKKALEAYTQRHGERAPADESARRMLVKVTEAGPWTEPAWEAARLLGVTK